ncbi:Arm DNA-binding domain-containing protein [Burkholderia sola]|uniref:Arm DNA-binding domain-containing protein n=1 Tax=Burkholderia sola TaxID=2843302 RepID=UPI00338FC9FC
MSKSSRKVKRIVIVFWVIRPSPLKSVKAPSIKGLREVGGPPTSAEILHEPQLFSVFLVFAMWGRLCVEMRVPTRLQYQRRAIMGALTVRQIEAEKATGKLYFLSDGRGLFLRIGPDGSMEQPPETPDTVTHLQ